jgi:hypothetical protein
MKVFGWVMLLMVVAVSLASADPRQYPYRSAQRIQAAVTIDQAWYEGHEARAVLAAMPYNKEATLGAYVKYAFTPRFSAFGSVNRGFDNKLVVYRVGGEVLLIGRNQ